mgnify:CR=1 FL=1
MPPRTKKRDDYYRDRRRRKVCSFCADKTVAIDYKEVNRLRRYLSERAKIEPRRKTGTCAQHQRELSIALKRARVDGPGNDAYYTAEVGTLTRQRVHLLPDLRAALVRFIEHRREVVIRRTRHLLGKAEERA